MLIHTADGQRVQKDQLYADVEVILILINSY
jgi:hypothetical protein